MREFIPELEPEAHDRARERGGNDRGEQILTIELLLSDVRDLALLDDLTAGVTMDGEPGFISSDAE